MKRRSLLAIASSSNAESHNIVEKDMSRTRINLDGTWEFFIDPEQHLQSLEDATSPRHIQVPGPWQAQFEDLRNYSGIAWYRRSFELPAETPNDAPCVYVLHFGAVDYHATVWLNGQLIGEHEGGYLPFEFTVDHALRPGRNDLVVRVIDASNDYERFANFPFNEVPHGKQSWYGPIGGIWQSVTLERRAPTHLTSLKITPDVEGERALVYVRLNRAAEQEYTLLLTITDPQGQIAQHEQTIAADSTQHSVVVPIPEPMLWDTEHPHLYTLEAALQPNPAIISDRLSSTFGMRTIATSPDGQLLLNGKILYLRGALDQDYYPELIYTPFSDAQLDDQFAKAKHMGLNCLRTHIKITDPRYYDAADRAGMLIWTELPNWNLLTPAVKERAKATLTGMVERDWNHPSIIIWTIINENWGTDLMFNADHRAWLAQTYDFMKQLDPTRLVVDNSGCHGNFHVVSDLDDFHVYYSVPDHYRSWDRWCEIFANRPDWSYAFDYENFENVRDYNRDPWAPIARKVLPEVRRSKEEPLIVSEFGNWGLPDVDQLLAGYGGKEPWWFQTGMDRGAGEVYPHDVQYRFKQYHLDKVFGTLSNLSKASQGMQFVAMKHEIEQMRRHAPITGYVITEFTDVHWESNGLLDMCRNPKAYYNIIGSLNHDNVLIVDSERTVFWEKQSIELPISLSYFSPQPLVEGRLEWQIADWPETHGVRENINAKPGQLLHLGAVKAQVPALEKSARVVVQLRLFDAQGQQVASNDHELYVFPKAAAQAPTGLIWAAPELAEQLPALGYQLTDDRAQAQLVVANVITDELREYVQSGGRVLWLDATSENQQTVLGNLNVRPRKGQPWQGDWASSMSWINENRMFRALPTEHLVDFAFAGLTPDYVITGLRAYDFAANVHAGLFVGWLHRNVALVAEKRFGAGRVLISTFNLSAHLVSNPVAQIMVRDMIAALQDS